jgi:hypothetical protein
MIFSLLSPVLTQIKAIPGGELTQFLLILILLSIVFQVALMAILKILQFIVGKTTTTLDDRILKAVRPFLPIIAALTGLWMSIETVAPTITIINNKQLLLLHQIIRTIIIMIKILMSTF